MGKFRIPEAEMFALDMITACLAEIEPCQVRQNLEMNIVGDGGERTLLATVHFRYSVTMQVSGIMTRQYGECGEWTKFDCTIQPQTDRGIYWKFSRERSARQSLLSMVETTARVPHVGIFNPVIKDLAETLRNLLPAGSKYVLFFPPFIDPTALDNGTRLSFLDAEPLENLARKILAFLPMEKIDQAELDQENQALMHYYGISTGAEGELYVHARS